MKEKEQSLHNPPSCHNKHTVIPVNSLGCRFHVQFQVKYESPCIPFPSLENQKRQLSLTEGSGNTKGKAHWFIGREGGPHTYS